MIVSQSHGLLARYQSLSTSRKFILIVFIIWLVQALPKWAAAVTADDELSSKIMRMFVTPRSERIQLPTMHSVDSRQESGVTGSAA